LDGAQHVKRSRKDEIQTSFLKSEGYRVLRFWNDQVLESVEEVLGVIDEVLGGVRAVGAEKES
jgi:very-short-patch-repair endonuclease